MKRGITSLGGLAMSTANKRRMKLDLPEVLHNEKGNLMRVNKKGRFVRK